MKAGHPPLFSHTIEKVFIEYINSVGDWGFPFDQMDLRYLAKHYLDSRHIEKPQLQNNLPGVDWAKSFLMRHKNEISSRLASNISRKRAAVSEERLREFFQHTEADLREIPPENLINYDETALTDDPGAQKFIFQRGSKAEAEVK